MSEPDHEARHLIATARNEAGEVVKVVDTVGEPALISHHLLHIEGVVSVDLEFPDDDAGGSDALG